jgi:hypothetical protein
VAGGDPKQGRVRETSIGGSQVALRVAALGLLLVVASLGVAALSAVELSATPPTLGDGEHVNPIVGVVFVLLVVAALAVSLRRRRLARERRYATGRRMSPLSTLVMLLLFALLWTVLDLGERFRNRLRAEPVPPPNDPSEPSSGLPDLTDPATLTLLVLLTAVLMLALVGVLTWRSRGAALRQSKDDPSEGEPVPDTDADGRLATVLGRALDDGQLALATIGPPRAAVISCYAAMESALSGTGHGPAASETPDELLLRARAVGILQPGAADTLTRLFHEARFSAHPVGEEQRQAARAALQRLRSELRVDAERS